MATYVLQVSIILFNALASVYFGFNEGKTKFYYQYISLPLFPFCMLFNDEQVFVKEKITRNKVRKNNLDLERK